MASIGEFFRSVSDTVNYFTVNIPDWRDNPTQTITRWDDILGAAMGAKLHSTRDKVDYDYEEVALKFQSGGSITNANDRVCWNVQKEHKIKIDSDLRYHIHFEQTDNLVREFTLQYRIQANGQLKDETWHTLVATTAPENMKFPYVSGTLIQILKFPDIDWSAYGISSTMDFRIARTDSETGDVLVKFIDGHVEIDSDGSTTEYAK